MCASSTTTWSREYCGCPSYVGHMDNDDDDDDDYNNNNNNNCFNNNNYYYNNNNNDLIARNLCSKKVIFKPVFMHFRKAIYKRNC
jgi:hypothetical protein